MQAFVFEFTFDSSGTPDEITLPADLPLGSRNILLHPPSGHAWTFYGLGATGAPRTTDQTLQLTRSTQQAAFLPGEVIGRATLDSGSGTGIGLVT